MDVDTENLHNVNAEKSSCNLDRYYQYTGNTCSVDPRLGR